MEKGLSRETLKAHNATGTSSDSKHDTISHKSLGQRDRAGTMQSESSTGTGKLKLMRLRHKIKLFGGSFSKSGSETQIQKQYENTYRLEPDDNARFSTKKAEDTIQHVLENYLKGKKYDPKKFPNLCKSLAELIKERVKTTGCQRYKLISHVMIFENKDQSIRYVSRCLWSKEFDNYATATYETSEFVAVGSVYAAYYD